LIEYFHLDVEAFMLVGKSLTISVEDIYFIIGLSRREKYQTFKVEEEVGEVSMITIMSTVMPTLRRVDLRCSSIKLPI
jgi:hypothetical protein